LEPLFLERKIKIKAVPRAVGIEYSKIHEVSDVFPGIGGRFPDWFRAEMGFLMESLRVLFKKEEPRLYGEEEALLPPKGVMDRGYAEDATERAAKTYNLCDRLVAELEALMGKMS